MKKAALYRPSLLLHSAVLSLVVLAAPLGRILAQTGSSLDHFSWSAIVTPQQAGQAFAATLQASDISNNQLTSFNGVVTLSGSILAPPPVVLITEVSGDSPSGVELSNLSQDSVDVSGWRVIFYDNTSWPAPRMTFTLPQGTLCPRESVFQVTASSPYLGSYPVFSAGAGLSWVPADFIAVLLLDATGSPVDFFCEGGAFPGLIALPFAIPSNVWSGPATAANNSFWLTYQRVGHANQHNAADWSLAPSSFGALNQGLALPFLGQNIQLPLMPGSVMLTNGQWIGQVTVGAGGSNVVLRADDNNGHPGNSNPFDVLGLPAVSLQIPHAAYKATPGAVGPCSVSIPQPLSSNLMVTLSSSLPLGIAAPVSVSISAAATNAGFWLTNFDDGLLTGPEAAIIVATAPGYSSASDIATNYDSSSPTLSVSGLPDAIFEGYATSGTVSSSAPPASNVRVGLFSSQPDRLQVPDSVILLAGTTSASFTALALALGNNRIVGGVPVTVSASVPGWTSGQMTLLATGNDNTHLSLSLGWQVTTGSGLLAGGGEVWISGVLATNLVVSLTNPSPAKLQIPATVTIPAGQTAVTFDITVPNDTLLDGNQVVTITATAPGFFSAAWGVTVIDNELSSFALGGLPPAQMVGQPFVLTVYAENLSGTVLAGYSGSLALSASANGGNIAVRPGVIGPFTNGIWSGPVSVMAPGRGVELTAADALGHSGSNGPMDVIAGRLLTLPISDIVYDPARQKVYVGVPGSAGTNGQSVIAVDPTAGVASAPIGIGSDPGLLAISSDSQFLYVARPATGGVARIDLNLNAVDLTFNVGSGAGSFPYEMAVPPGDPHALVAWISGDQGMALYRDGVPSPNMVAPEEFSNDPYDIVFYDSATNFYSVSQVSFYGLSFINISSQGLNYVRYVPGYTARYIYEGGLLFSTTGDVYDPVNLRHLGAYPASGWVAADANEGRVYFLSGGVLQVCDMCTFAEIGQINVPISPGTAFKLLSCGANGLAVATSSQLLLIQSDLTPMPASADLSVTQLTTGGAAIVGSNFVYSLTVSNAGPALAPDVILADLLPADALLVSATNPAGPCSLTNGILRCDLGALAPGTSLTTTLVIQPATPGSMVNLAWVIGDGINLANAASRMTNTVVFGSVPPAVARLWFNADSLAYDPVRNLLWASSERFGGALATSLRSVNLSNGLPGSVVSLSYPSTKIAISADAQYLYASYFEPSDISSEYPNTYGTHIARANLLSGAVDLTFPPVDSALGADILVDMIGTASYPGGIAVASLGLNSDVGVYVNGRAIRTTLSGQGPGKLEVNPEIKTRLYMLMGNYDYNAGASISIYNFVRMDVGSSAIAVLPGSDLIGVAGDIRFGNGLLFSDIGVVANAEAVTNVAELPAVGLVQTDPSSGLAFYLVAAASQWTLTAFDMNTLTPVWAFVVPGATGNAAQLTRCGPGMLAFKTDDDQLFILNATQLPHTLQSDVSVTLTTSANAATTNVPVTFTTTVYNPGPAPQMDVILTNQFSGDANILSVTSSQGTVTNSLDAIICDLGGMQIGASASLQVVATLAQGGTLTNVAFVTPSAPDPVATNNSASAAVEFDTIAISDVSVSQFAAVAPGALGSNFVCSLVVSNAGPNAATNVTVSYSIASGAALVSATSSQGAVSVSGGSLSGNLGVIAAGSAATVTLTLSPSGGLVINSASVGSDAFDPNPANNNSFSMIGLSNANGLNLVDQLPVSASDIGYDSPNQLIVASTPAAARPYANSVVGLSATNGSMNFLVSVGNPLGRVALSDDGRYAYVGIMDTGGVARVDIPSQAVGLRFALSEPDPIWGPVVADDLAVMPGFPDTLAVARGVSVGLGGAVALYDSGTQRPGIIGDLIFTIRVGFSGATNLCITSPAGFESAIVTTAGLTNLGPVLTSYTTDFALDGGLVFLSDGRVFDPDTGALIATYPASSGVVPDLANHRVYFITGQTPGNYLYFFLALHAFDTDTGAEAWSLTLPFNSYVGYGQRFIGLGTNGLAFTTDDNRVFVVRTSQLSQPQADLSIQAAPTSPVTVGGTVTYAFTIQNFGPCPATGVVFSNALPASADFISASSTVGTCVFTNGAILCGLGVLTNGASAAVTIVLSPLAVGTLNDAASVSLNETDYNPLSNSTAVQTTVKAAPAVWIGDAAALKPASSTSITFPVTLSGPASESISVQYQTADGTAVAGVDYNSASGVITFAPGTTNQQLGLDIILGSTLVASNRYFLLNLSGLTNVLPARTQAVGTILEDHFRSIKITGATVVKGTSGFTNAVFHVSLSQSNALPVTAQYQTIDGTAVAGVDYEAKAGSIVFPSGTTNLTLAVPVFGNTVVEPNRTFFITLSQPNNAILGVDEAQATIIGTGPAPTPPGVAAWGDDSYGQTEVPLNLTNVIAIAGGWHHSVALMGDGTVTAWGDDDQGQTNVPANLSNVVAIASRSGDHSMALRADGTVAVWGDNSYGQTNVPAGLSNVVAIAAGGYQCLVLKEDGTAFSWGSPDAVPAGLSNVVAIAAGDYANLFLLDGGTVAAAGTGVPAGLSNIVAIAAGGLHYLALRADGTIVPWGGNSYGQISIPAGLADVVAIGAGDYHSIALRADGTVAVWGNYYNEVRFSPAAAPADLANAVAIAAGSDHDLALLGSGPPLPELRPRDIGWGGGLFSCSLPTQSGRVYRLEYKNSLADAAWTPLPLIAGNGRVQVLSDGTAAGAQRFYRVRRW
jgi:uncharacterized repeat protein (TIGR01451 family)